MPYTSLRGSNVSRLEGFSDAVFGFALTILVVSLDAPKTIGDLQRAIHGIAPFALCFSFLVLIWYKHYRFFREYGMEDGRTILLNSILLFTVLFYIYPLRLLFNLWVSFLTRGEQGSPTIIITPHQFALLLATFDIGFAAVMGAFGALYAHAHQCRATLKLTEPEVADTWISMTVNLVLAGIGAVSLVLTFLVPMHHILLAGWVYLLILPLVLIVEPILRHNNRQSKQGTRM